MSLEAELEAVQVKTPSDSWVRKDQQSRSRSKYKVTAWPLQVSIRVELSMDEASKLMINKDLPFYSTTIKREHLVTHFSYL